MANSQTKIKPLKGKQLEKIERMERDVRILLECLAKEKTGVRDGDGFWQGCNPIDEIIFDLERARRGQVVIVSAIFDQQRKESMNLRRFGRKDIPLDKRMPSGV